MLFVGFAGYGDSILQSIQVAFNTVKIEVNGRAVTADNILYNGTTYVPLRAIAEMLGKEVVWDGAANTAHINDKSKQGETGGGETAPPADSEGQDIRPAAIGEQVIVNFEHNQYAFKAYMTLREVVRGEYAWRLVKEANATNSPPKENQEYLLARFNFWLNDSENARKYTLSTDSFTLVSQDGKAYGRIAVITPRPYLGGELNKGDTSEGWVAFLVEKTDKKPLVCFDGSGGGSGKMWFKAYQE
jgi:hypothetical protein